jgi:hypothetical protein
LLPFNFAIGVNGRVDIIIKTIQLAVDQYIIEPEQNGNLPSRGLVSLDIRNMFNAVSRERIREIISEKFYSLEPYADLNYDGAGETFVRLMKMENGSSLQSTRDFHKVVQYDLYLLPLYFTTSHPESNQNLKRELTEWDPWDSLWHTLTTSTTFSITVTFNSSSTGSVS